MSFSVPTPRPTSPTTPGAAENGNLNRWTPPHRRHQKAKRVRGVLKVHGGWQDKGTRPRWPVPSACCCWTHGAEVDCRPAIWRRCHPPGLLTTTRVKQAFGRCRREHTISERRWSTPWYDTYCSGSQRPACRSPIRRAVAKVGRP